MSYFLTNKDVGNTIGYNGLNMMAFNFIHDNQSFKYIDSNCLRIIIVFMV